MKSIEYTRNSAKKQPSPLNFCKSPSADLFTSLGLNIEQFNFFFNELPVAISLNKVLYDNSGVPVDFMILAVNSVFERTVGFKKEQMLNKYASDFYPKIRDKEIDWVCKYGRVASTGKSERFEIQCLDTQKYFYVTIYSPKRDYCFSVFVDITEQKNLVKNQFEQQQKIEAALKESLDKYRYLIKHAPTAICEVDYETLKFKSANDAMIKLLGYSEKELLSISPFDLLYPESLLRFQEKISKGRDRKKVAEEIEYHCKTKDGQGIYCVLNMQFVRKLNNPIEVLVVVHDVTARKKAEEQLVLAEKTFRRLFETTQDGIMARDLQGRMITCNPAYAKMLGYTRKELKNLMVKQLLPPKWRKQRERIVKKILLSGRSIVFEREYRRKDGSVFPASVRTWRLTNGKGRVIGLWSIVRDITEQKAQQKNLEEHAGFLEKMVADRTKQLKDSERLIAIGQTAGMVGHDLRNPLQTLTGELYLAKEEVGALQEGDIKNNLNESIRLIEEQVTYMDKIVSDLQAFVQPVQIDKKPVDLPRLADEVLASVDIPKNVSVQFVRPEVFATVKVDQYLIKRVLINLVTNAVQAMPDGGTLTMVMRNLPSGKVSVVVQDTGVGIADKIKSQIFTPLFTTKPRGQGFGLAVCKRVIEAHGGAISFDSTEGRGTKFTIQFPTS